MKYKVITVYKPLTSVALTQLWSEGWELISVTPIQKEYGPLEYAYYFKRYLITNKEDKNEGNEVRVCQA